MNVRMIILFLTVLYTISGFSQVGIASYYGKGFHGKLTANGEVYNQNAMTCAHRTYPFGTILQVTNLDNDKSVLVKVTDRGPYYGNRIIDLSVAAAQKLEILHKGITKVRIKIISKGDGKYNRQSAKRARINNQKINKSENKIREYTFILDKDFKKYFLSKDKYYIIAIC